MSQRKMFVCALACSFLVGVLSCVLLGRLEGSKEPPIVALRRTEFRPTATVTEVYGVTLPAPPCTIHAEEQICFELSKTPYCKVRAENDLRTFVTERSQALLETLKSCLARLHF